MRARRHTIGGLSAHAGQDGLIGWLAGAHRKPKMTYIVHGEPEASHALSARWDRLAAKVRAMWSSTLATPFSSIRGPIMLASPGPAGR